VPEGTATVRRPNQSNPIEMRICLFGVRGDKRKRRFLQRCVIESRIERVARSIGKSSANVSRLVVQTPRATTQFDEREISAPRAADRRTVESGSIAEIGVGTIVRIAGRADGIGR